MGETFKHDQRVIHHAGSKGDHKAKIVEVRVGKNGPEFVVKYNDGTIHVAEAADLSMNGDDRQRDYEARRVAGGGRRLPSTILGARATVALEGLRDSAYGKTIKAVIERALIEAYEGL